MSRRIDPHELRILWPRHDIPTRAIAAHFGVTRQAVSWAAHRAGLPPRTRLRRRLIDPDELRDMWLAGVASPEIARHFGVAHHSCVTHSARKMGLPRRIRSTGGMPGARGGWLPTITLQQYFEMRLAQAMADEAASRRRVA
jgi:hypothetical protein